MLRNDGNPYQVAPLDRRGHGDVDRGRTVDRHRSDRPVQRSVDRLGRAEGRGVRRVVVVPDLDGGVADGLVRRPVRAGAGPELEVLLLLRDRLQRLEDDRGRRPGISLMLKNI